MLDVNQKICKKIITPNNDFSKTTIAIGGSFNSFIDSSITRSSEVLICPTGALQLSESRIDLNTCVECLLCCFTSPEKVVRFVEELGSFKKFNNYCIDNPTFVTYWVAILLSSTKNNAKVGIEVKVGGGSREKRIPLLSVIDDKATLWKVAKSPKNVERAALALNDISELVNQSGGNKPSKIVILIESSEKNKSHDMILKFFEAKTGEHNFKLITLEYLWNVVKNWISTNSIDWDTTLFNNSKRIFHK